ncbi:MAG: branched-chain amino acid ABC transporter permease [Nitrospirota bacterium]
MQMLSSFKTILIGSLWCGLLVIPFMGVQGALLVAAVLVMGAIGYQTIFRQWALGRFSKMGLLLSGVYSRLRTPVLGRRFWGIGVVALLVVPIFLNNYYLDILTLALLYALLAVGLNITVGLTGLLDLGYAGFYGIGAYAYALLSTKWGLSFWLGVPFGAVIAASFGLLLGVITLRLRGDYLAIVTLGFVQIVYLVLNNWDSLTNGPNGILQIKQPEIGSFLLEQPIHFYYLALFFLIVALFVVYRIAYSQMGRAFCAIREDPIAAEAMGIDTTRMKILAFVLGAGVAGVAGVFFAAKYTFVSPESFTFFESVRILTMVVLGGMGSLFGAVLGAFLLTFLPEMLRGLDLYRMLIFGATLVLMMMVRPQGLLGTSHK